MDRKKIWSGALAIALLLTGCTQPVTPKATSTPAPTAAATAAAPTAPTPAPIPTPEPTPTPIPLNEMVIDRYHVEYDKPDAYRLDITIPMFREDLPGVGTLNEQIGEDWSFYLNTRPEDFPAEGWGFAYPMIQTVYNTYSFGSAVELVVRIVSYSVYGSGVSSYNIIYCYDAAAGEAVSLDTLLDSLGIAKEDVTKTCAAFYGDSGNEINWDYDTDVLHYFYIDGDGAIQIEGNQ